MISVTALKVIFKVVFSIPVQVDEGYGPKQIYKDDPTAEVYVRIFGNELLWVPLNKQKLEDAVKELESSAEQKFQNVNNIFLCPSICIFVALSFIYSSLQFFCCC